MAADTNYTDEQHDYAYDAVGQQVQHIYGYVVREELEADIAEQYPEMAKDDVLDLAHDAVKAHGPEIEDLVR